MTTTRRTATVLMATAIATGAVVSPTMAMLPPEPDASTVEQADQSPALTAGRAWCACRGVDYEPLWIR